MDLGWSLKPMTGVLIRDTEVAEEGVPLETQAEMRAMWPELGNTWSPSSWRGQEGPPGEPWVLLTPGFRTSGL